MSNLPTLVRKTRQQSSILPTQSGLSRVRPRHELPDCNLPCRCFLIRKLHLEVESDLLRCISVSSRFVSFRSVQFYFTDSSCFPHADKWPILQHLSDSSPRIQPTFQVYCAISQRVCIVDSQETFPQFSSSHFLAAISANVSLVRIRRVKQSQLTSTYLECVSQLCFLICQILVPLHHLHELLELNRVIVCEQTEIQNALN